MRALSWIIAMSLALAGCRQVNVDAHKLLAEPRMSTASVVLDLFFVRLPAADEQFANRLWNEVDEQKLPPAQRERLARYGFRAGVCGAHPPADLERLINQEAATVQPAKNTISDFAVDPVVRRRHLQLLSGRPAEVIASSMYESLPLLEAASNGAVSGQTFKQAQGVFSLRAVPESDGRVRLTLVPEVQHGEAKQQFMQRDTHLEIVSQKPRKTYESLTTELPLAPGEMLILGAWNERRGSVGHYFFTEPTSSGLVHKVLVVRLSQTQHDSAVGAELAVDQLPSAALADQSEN